MLWRYHLLFPRCLCSYPASHKWLLIAVYLVRLVSQFDIFGEELQCFTLIGPWFRFLAPDRWWKRCTGCGCSWMRKGLLFLRKVGVSGPIIVRDRLGFHGAHKIGGGCSWREPSHNADDLLGCKWRHSSRRKGTLQFEGRKPLALARILVVKLGFMNVFLHFGWLISWFPGASPMTRLTIRGHWEDENGSREIVSTFEKV